jgi:hypothetical protein
VNTNKLRILSATSAVAALLVATTPAWAHYEHGFGSYYWRGHSYAAAPRYYYPSRSPAVVVARPVVPYFYTPAPVYYPPPAYAPAPVYLAYPTYYGPLQTPYSPLGAFGGAVAGAAVGSRLGQGNGRVASIALGTTMGALIGGQLARGH